MIDLELQPRTAIFKAGKVAVCPTKWLLAVQVQTWQAGTESCRGSSYSSMLMVVQVSKVMVPSVTRGA